MAEASSSTTKSPPELTSILTQVQSLQADREKLIKELEAAKSKVDTLQSGKREEMRKVLDTVIAKWLTESVENEESRKQFTDGMERLVTDTRENSGVWQVAVAASASHAKQLSELEKLRTECTELRTHTGGKFAGEASRKREREEDPGGFDIWGDFKVTPV